jgi:hypothetical protein
VGNRDPALLVRVFEPHLLGGGFLGRPAGCPSDFDRRADIRAITWLKTSLRLPLTRNTMPARVAGWTGSRTCASTWRTCLSLLGCFGSRAPAGPLSRRGLDGPTVTDLRGRRETRIQRVGGGCFLVWDATRGRRRRWPSCAPGGPRRAAGLRRPALPRLRRGARSTCTVMFVPVCGPRRGGPDPRDGPELRRGP